MASLKTLRSASLLVAWATALVVTLSPSRSLAQADVSPRLKPTPAPVSPAPARHEEKPVELGRTSEEIEQAEKKSDYDFSLGEKDLSIGYEGALLGIAIPLKHGPFISYRTDNVAYEGAWFGGSLSLDTSFFSIGSVKENLIIAHLRRFVGKSTFNWIIGLSQQTYEASVGQDILVNTTGAPTSADLIKIRTLGLQVGLGNRWQMANGFMFGDDWLVVNVP
ncbi:MAG: hypothetical protein V4760_06605, partial [Bdellovibrionota bacterium]